MKELVSAFGHRLIKNKLCDVIYAFEYETFDQDSRQFAKELRLVDESKKEGEYLVRDVQCRLEKLKKRRFLFMFLNVFDNQKIYHYMY